MYLVSVIIPVYNAEKTIERAIDSVINQTFGFNNIELILVDDNSSDNSKSIIQEYSDKYDNIVPVFLEDNHGSPSIPRNYGIKAATSEFLMFMDNDDEYCPDLCKKLYETIVKENVDLVSCGIYKGDEIHVSKNNFNYADAEYSMRNNHVYYSDSQIFLFDNVYIWNKIFKRKIVVDNNIEFKHHVGEDILFCTEYLMHSYDRVYLEDYFGYYWHVHDDSLSVRVNNIEKIKKQLNLGQMLYDLLKSNLDVEKFNSCKDFILTLPIESMIGEIISLKDDNDKKYCLNLLYSFENEIFFRGQLRNLFFNVINKLILKKQFNVVILICNLSNYFKKSNFLRKLYRIFLE